MLEELNDYLMAIQILRADDPKATDIFKMWQELRAASWKIRELTDEQDLLINADQVMAQINATRAKRKKLLEECRAYFTDLMQKEPAIRFVVDNVLQVEWNNPSLEVQIQHSKLIPIEIRNQTDLPAILTMKADQSDEILFWNKRFILAAHSSRFTFVVCTPLSLKSASSVVQISDSLGRKAEAAIKVRGIPMTQPPYTLLPGEYLSKVKLPDTTAGPDNLRKPFEEAIKFKVRDKDSGELLSTRIEVWDEDGNFYWFPLQGPTFAMSRTSGWVTPLWEHQPGPYFYIKGEAELGVNPNGKTAKLYHGFEYIPTSVKIPQNGEVEIALERWINMPAKGWYAGHTHIHTTDAGMPVQFTPYWPVISQGEDLHVSAILTLKGEWETHAIYANEYPMGKREAFSTEDHIIAYGEEYRNNPYGHLAFIGLDYLIQPISSGALGELGGPDYPPNALVLEEALAQGAATIAAHFGNFIPEVQQIKTPWPSTGFEMPIDIALNKIQMAEIYGNGGQLEVWYDILNCGFRLPATAGPDWVIKDSPRVYVNLGKQEFTLENWIKGLQKGNSFITRGPMLFFSANGQQAGSEINVRRGPAKISVKANALSPVGKEPVELLFNGRVIASGTDLNTKVTINDSGWLAARCLGAHSNPIYIQIKGRPAGEAAPARKFINIIDQLEDWVNKKGLFDTEEQKQEVLTFIDRGRKVYEHIIQQAEELGRE